MGIPLRQQLRVGAYVLKQRLLGRPRYPLVLMLEPLFRCNLACAGCGKIDYPTPILNRRLSVQECLDAADECGAPVVSIPGGEPLIHKEIADIVKGLIARRKFIYLCTNALLVEKKIDLFEPSPYLTFSIHLDGLRAHHDRSVCQDGVFDRAVAATRLLRGRGFRVNVNTTLFNGVAPDEAADFFDHIDQSRIILYHKRMTAPLDKIVAGKVAEHSRNRFARRADTAGDVAVDGDRRDFGRVIRPEPRFG